MTLPWILGMGLALFSSVLTLWLARYDRKRIRNLPKGHPARNREPLSKGKKRLLALLILLPGLVLISMAWWSTFTIWLSGLLMLTWSAIVAITPQNA